MHAQTNEVVIIGGGVAGLCAAIGLQEKGYQSHIIEGGNYPSHKVCGEFISPGTLSLLESWGIRPVLIREARYYTGKRSFSFPFEECAGGLSHLSLDPQLLTKALAMGATIKTGVKVESFEPKKGVGQKHRIHLDNGVVREASTVIVATGKLPTLPGQDANPLNSSQFVGYKTHFSGIPITDALEMFLTEGAYLGISPIEDNKVNIACLVKKDRLNRHESIDSFMNEFCEEIPRLKELLSQGSNLLERWIQTTVPSFGFRETPDWLDTYFIGDAAMSIPPASGQGLSLGIFGGIEVATAIERGNNKQFQRLQKKKRRRQMLIAMGIHHVVMDPLLARLSITGCSRFPWLAEQLFHHLQ